ncbi:MAG: transglycosylase SLT domain-containing protein [Gammaproteobacteria bacterium]|jgi:soluble lytic murein transglycosylase|nr:transglycosylase SLT domain-containing protein [Gammaproteobacteria bacterium]
MQHTNAMPLCQHPRPAQAQADSATAISRKPIVGRWLLWLLCWLISLTGPVLAATAERTQQREHFRQAWAALAQADWDLAVEHAVALQDYPLLPYLRAEQIRQRSSAFSDENIAEFLQLHSDWAFHDSVRRNWLRTLGRDSQWQRLLKQAQSSDTDAEIQCYLARARILHNDSDSATSAELMRRVQNLWLTGNSQHKACDPAFAWLQQRAGISSELAWQRVALAMTAGNTGLVRYLRRFMQPQELLWTNRWLQMNASVIAGLKQARSWPDQQQAWTIADFGLQRLARQNHEQAYRYWQQLDNHFTWPAEQRAQALHAVALYGSLELQTQALSIIDQLPETASDPQLLAWRARVAMANLLWPQVLESIERMPLTQQQDGRWRYWQAQALQASEQQGAAHKLLQTLSNEATYHGFLAADWLQQPYQICATPAANDDWRSLPTAAQLERAVELHYVELNSYADRAWRQALAPLDARQRALAAQLAADHEWWLQSVMTLIDDATRQMYALRFPVSYEAIVRQQANVHQVDTALIYGLMRAESAMNPQAISSANARGLMQVTPATARALASRHGLSYSGSASLLQADTNITFGTTMLADMLARYAGDPVLVLGAYNAGPQVLQRWQQQNRPERPDIWVETIPYFETREYIPRVLAFSVIYDWLLNGDVTPISARMPGMHKPMQWRTSAVAGRRAVRCEADEATTAD